MVEHSLAGLPGAEVHRIATSGGELAVAVAGEGPEVLFLHGFPTSSFLWRNLAPGVWMSGTRALVPDLLGYGASEKPDRAELHPRAQARYVREALGKLGVDRYAVVGHDVGGAVAQMLALDHGGAEAMVLLDAAAFDAWPIEGVRMLQEATPDQQTAAFAAEVIDLAIELGVSHRERLTEEVRTAYRAPFAGDDGARAFFRAARGIDGVGLVGREADLEALAAPALLLWGEDDPYLGVEVGERLQEAMPTASLAVLPGCSHLLPEDAPETVGPLVAEWLASRYLGRRHGHGDDHGHAGPSGPVPIEIRPFRGD
jgi:2-hydroxymuconate-semialdehyde hydrolase